VNKGCPILKDVDLIRKLFNDPEIELSDDGSSYKRSLPTGGKTKLESVFGKPVLK